MLAIFQNQSSLLTKAWIEEERNFETYYKVSRNTALPFLPFVDGAWQCLNKRDIDGLPTQAVQLLLHSSFFLLWTSFDVVYYSLALKK